MIRIERPVMCVMGETATTQPTGNVIPVRIPGSMAIGTPNRPWWRLRHDSQLAKSVRVSMTEYAEWNTVQDDEIYLLSKII